jgi:hypothetical protein
MREPAIDRIDHSHLVLRIDRIVRIGYFRRRPDAVQADDNNALRRGEVPWLCT